MEGLLSILHFKCLSEKDLPTRKQDRPTKNGRSAPEPLCETKMTPEETIKELENYRDELAGIMKRFVRSSDSYRIKREDDPRYRTIVIELVDLINDLIGKNKYSQLIYQLFTEGITNYFQTPSYKSIEDVILVLHLPYLLHLLQLVFVLAAPRSQDLFYSFAPGH